LVTGGRTVPGRGSGRTVVSVRRAPSWIPRLVVLALVAGVASALARALRPEDAGHGLVPSIGGDTWPPVPVKDSRPV